MRIRPIKFRPPISEEELSLFAELDRRRVDDLETSLDQKRIAEVLLEVHRPLLFQVYLLRKRGMIFRDIARELSLSVGTVKGRARQSVFWLQKALLGGMD